MVSAGKMEEPTTATVDDASGQVFVADGEKGAVYEYSPTGALEVKLTGSSSPEGSFLGKEEEEGNVSAVAIDETTGDLLVAEAERHLVSEFNAGRRMGWLDQETPRGPLGEPFGVGGALRRRLRQRTRRRRRSTVFGAGVVVPDVTRAKAPKRRARQRVLNGTINGDGEPGNTIFQWGTTNPRSEHARR